MLICLHGKCFNPNYVIAITEEKWPDYEEGGTKVCTSVHFQNDKITLRFEETPEQLVVLISNLTEGK